MNSHKTWHCKKWHSSGKLSIDWFYKWIESFVVPYSLDLVDCDAITRMKRVGGDQLEIMRRGHPKNKQETSKQSEKRQMLFFPSSLSFVLVYKKAKSTKQKAKNKKRNEVK